MGSGPYSEVGSREIEQWTSDDAEAWREAQRCAESEGWLDEEPLLESDLIGTDAGDTISIGGLGRLAVRI